MTAPSPEQLAAQQDVADAQSALDTLLASGTAEQEAIDAAEQALATATAALAQLDDEGDKPLGPAGEKALEAEKAKRRKAQADAREKDAELAAARAEIAQLKGGGGDDAERQKAIDDATTAATKKANDRILRAEVQRLATGKAANPKIVLQLLNLEPFHVDDDGNVDEEEISEAIDDLLEKEPYLKAQGRRFQGGGPDGGPRPPSPPGKPVQVTDAELDKMSPEEIVKARSEGRLEDLLTGG